MVILKRNISTFSSWFLKTVLEILNYLLGGRMDGQTVKLSVKI